jgi:ADP-heptose:LPS heptosyltransferase
MYTVHSFIEPSKLVEILKEHNYTLYVFGTGTASKITYNTLKDFRIPVTAYIDNNNKAKLRKKHLGRPVITPEDLKGMNNILVLIASMYYAEIMKQLSGLGMENVYVLSDTLFYRYKTAFKDGKWLLKHTDNTVKHSDKVLIKAWCGLGDHLVMLGILKYISESDPNGNKYYIITDAKFKQDLFSPLLKNVIFIDNKRYKNSTRYRRAMQKRINDYHFASAVGFHITPYRGYEFFDKHNTNIPNFHISYRYLERDNGITNATALERMEPMSRQLLNIPAEYNLDPKGLLANYLYNIHMPERLQTNYIAFSFGAASWNNCYKPEKIAAIVNHFIDSGYSVVLLGAGRTDVKCNKKVLKLTGTSCKILNLTNVNLYTTFKVIQGAELFIGIDSGLSHAAYSLDKKAVILRPAGTELANCFEHKDDKNMTYLTAKLPCSDCVYCIHPYKTASYGECISKIDPADVIAAAEELLGRN